MLNGLLKLYKRNDKRKSGQKFYDRERNKRKINMKLGIMQPYFLPYIGYFQLINAVDKYVIYDDVNYIKGGWINRNKLLLNEKEFMFNLILSGASPNKLINEVLVAANQSKLLKTIEGAYKKAPYFNEVLPVILSIVEYEDKNLARFIGNSLIQIADYLKFNTIFMCSSELQKNYSLKAQDKVINICSVLQATQYFNAFGGMGLYSKSDFETNNIKLCFLKPQPIEYKQFNNKFVPNLSMLDVLMFNPVEEINKLLYKYDLI